MIDCHVLISIQSFDTLQGSKDNMSVVLVTFPGAPKVSPEAQRKDKELKEVLEKKVQGKFQVRTKCTKTILTLTLLFLEILAKNNNEITLNSLIQNLSYDSIENLPPGAGIEAK